MQSIPSAQCANAVTRIFSNGARALGALLVCTQLLACGGGGGGNGGASGGTAQEAPAASGAAANGPASGAAAASTPGAPAAGDPAASPSLSASSSVPQSSTPNVMAISVAATPTLTRNLLLASVTVCVPGTTTCATIDNVQIDTGSQGLRLLASALPAGFALPEVATGNAAAGTSAECAVFGTGYTWGAVRRADVRLAGETAASLPIQVIADPSLPAVPSDCSNGGAGLAMQNATSLRSNGILGVGLFTVDCGSNCVNAAPPRWYYACDDTGACTNTSQPLERQVTNPVSAFASDNNGVVIDLPSVPDGGSASIAGSLIFGIGTQANNTLGSASILRPNPATGYFTTTTADGTIYTQSYIDSGSNGLFFWSTTLPRCGLWFCPASQQELAATLKGTDGTTIPAAYSVASSQSLFATGNWAFDNLAGLSGNMFGWGLPFFYGRRVYTAITAQATPAGDGPYYAF